MSIAPQALLPFINKALDGMVSIAEQLGDQRSTSAPISPIPIPPMSFWCTVLA